MVVHLDTKAFLEKIFDYTTKKEWEYNGDLPALVDFYADWCGPCKMVAPVLEKLDQKYGGKINIYKVNTDQEHELASAFGITSIPALLFVPKDGQPQMALGAMTEKVFEQAFHDILKIEAVDGKE